MQIDATEQPTPRSAEWLAGWDAGRATAHPLAGQIDALRAERDELLVTLAGVQEQANIYEAKSARRARLLFEGAARAERMASAVTTARSQVEVAQGDAARYRDALENIEAESFEMFAVTVAADALHPESEGKAK